MMPKSSEKFRYQLPPDHRPHPIINALVYIGMLLFCVAIWAMIGYAAGCHVGWPGTP